MIVALFIGMIASGITARVTLLSQRGGWFLEDQARKSGVRVMLDLVGLIAGLAAFFLSFMLFDWWLPILALTFGYWFAAPFIVSRSTYAFFYQIQFMFSLVSLTCSLLICASFFEVI